MANNPKLPTKDNLKLQMLVAYGPIKSNNPHFDSGRDDVLDFQLKHCSNLEQKFPN